MKVTTMRVLREKNRAYLLNKIDEMKAKGWYCIGQIELDFNPTNGSELIQTMAFEGEKECEHEYEIFGNKKLCYHCLHKIPIDESVNNG